MNTVPDRPVIPIVQPAPRLPYDVGGHRYLLEIWSYQSWARLPEGERPGAEAREYPGIGYVVFQRERPG